MKRDPYRGPIYVAKNGTLTFAPGQKLRRVPVRIFNQGFKERTQTFRLTLANPSPGPVRMVPRWAADYGAEDPVTDPSPTLDLTTEVVGLDTVVTRYTSRPPGGAVELWTIHGSGHSPVLSPDFSPRVIDWLLAHPKP